MIDITKPLKAKIYDFDANLDIPDGKDQLGHYIMREVQVIVLLHLPYVRQAAIIYNGGRSESYNFLPQGS